MNRLILGAVTVICMVATASAQWSENFDSYAAGSQIHGQGGWEGWDGNVASGALVSDALSISAPNSIAIVGSNDPVRPVAGVNSGQWLLTANVFVPGNFTGVSWFIVQNTYNTAGGPKNWSLQMQFTASSNTVVNVGGSGNTVANNNITVTQRPLVRDQWVPLEVLIDLDNNTHVGKYNGEEVVSGTWAAGAGSNVAFGSLNLFANNASVVNYDNINLSVVPEPSVLVTLGIGLASLITLRRRK